MANGRRVTAVALGAAMDRLRVLVLGLGFFGKHWLKEIASCSECEVAGVVAKHPDLLAWAGEEFKIPASRRFATIAEGLERAGAHAVVVALPEMLHKEAILAALGRGLHVLTEKPLVMTMTEAREVVRAARGAKGFSEYGQLVEDRGEPPIYIYERLDEPTRSLLEGSLARVEGVVAEDTAPEASANSAAILLAMVLPGANRLAVTW